jgi:L-lactate dehydrogenase complex protein LldG
MTVTRTPSGNAKLAATFGSNLETAQGTYEIVERPGDVADTVARWISQYRSQPADRSDTPMQVLGWAPEEIGVPNLESRLKKSGMELLVPDDLHDEDVRRVAANAAVGITGVDAAFASTGSVVLASGRGKNRSASLLPLHHLMIVPANRIHPTFEDWLHSLRQAGELENFLRHSAQVAFVTGPSKSADIELNLTLGVHGPKVVHAIVVGDGTG